MSLVFSKNCSCKKECSEITYPLARTKLQKIRPHQQWPCTWRWTNELLWQWRKSVKIIGGDETEPTKVALIKKRIVA